ncbi:MAG: TRAP transporter large permease subunit [Aurantimonas endophytica]|uniref:TRAP transporter large permease protein n=1 Tax=Aurantimonas endophytica TaxID=1522175 RepID=A0A7W6MNU8_9HYPH|nr:TRAP transporter large permease subunit [Aurantimonas endophytica]MBB4002207.1 tripartite ATP-independent transporter DctM subunit [Aurantimonas endophytica]MCO6402164.1 TRAP transporter large permease subunit [Aurantimonas endophytica]
MPFTEILALGMIGAFFALLLLGVPVAVCLGATGLFFGWIGFGPMLFNLLPARIYGTVTNYTLLALPLFIFMGIMLEKSRIAERLLEVIGLAMGGLRGGMALAIILVGILMGAASGVVGATVVTLGLIALGPILNRGYDHGVAAGVICASGTLGQIIPPSLVLILLADIMGESVGTLFAAALIPSLILSGMFIVYILVLGVLRPESMPPIALAEREALTGRQLAGQVVKVVLPPLALIFLVLGSIIGGVAAPTEAASMGALGSILLALGTGRLNLTMLRDVTRSAFVTSAMVFLILIFAQPFGLAFRGLGGERLVQDAFAMVPGGLDGQILFLLALIFILGFFLEWIEISYIALPLFLPIFHAAGADMAWIAILVAINLQTSFLTPPFGWALFFLKGVAPPRLRTIEIYRGVVPFIAIQLFAVFLVYLFPQLALWLPDAIGW